MLMLTVIISVIKLSVIILSDVVLSVVILSDVVLNVVSLGFGLRKSAVVQNLEFTKIII